MRTVRFCIAAAFVCLMALAGAGVAGAIECLRPPLLEAVEALDASFSVDVSTITVASWDNSTAAPADDNVYYVFKPKRAKPKTGFIILPGGNCDPRAYAPAAHAIAAKGFLVCIVPMPNCIALPSGYKRIGGVMREYGQIEHWVIGGHSVGGTAASIYAVEADSISGVVIWASLANTDPAKTLANSTIKVLSVYGSEDGRATPEAVLENAEYLPAHTVFVEIEGGNHSQFGLFDIYPAEYIEGDNPATITIEEQQEKIVQATVDFLKQFDGNACPVISLFGGTDPRTMIVSRFRDEILKKTLLGRGIIACYEKTGAQVVAVFEKHPLIKSSARKLLEAVLPAIELLL